VEEIGRARPKTVSELMETANRFADGEDAHNNKRGRSPEVDKTSRQRRRYRKGDNYGRRNQIAAGYDERSEEGYENIEFPTRDSRRKEKPRYSGPSAEDMLYGPCRIHYAYLDGKKSFQPPDEGLQNLLKIAKCHELRPRGTVWRKKHKSRISNAGTRKTARIKSIYISNDPTSTKVEKRKEEHIKTG
jgi:hypothetical protein